MKNTVYMEEMDAFTYRDKLAQEAVMFIPVGALEQHGSHMAMCVAPRSPRPWPALRPRPW